MIEEFLNNSADKGQEQVKLKNTIYKVLFATGEEKLKLEADRLFVDEVEFVPENFDPEVDADENLNLNENEDEEVVNQVNDVDQDQNEEDM
eukprot:CAMPEP_0116937754 /NCGR_PEP_ID=MMETSP0467-20121206/31690_1 /TAXON_ID=283647 /ORGANISM="Mesodinium pulex, Strain SPMC105" /LENGTH=90 /DNA_ID=CAMNT_0004619625 /DNA_START=651 /DNA_END=923 /DNA_ORIENTATION=+